MSLNLSDEVAALFEQALKKPLSERSQFLDQVTQGKTALRTTLENLLTAANDAPDFIHSLSNNLGISSVLEGKLQYPPQQNLGPYKILRLLGRGGMGVVYLAERNDGQFQQQVAIKVLPFGAISKEEQERFLSERQILASLQHPNIARLLDGGIDNQGTPYFVMEFVDGLSVDKYCQNNNLAIEKRLRIFIDICNAVSYAHRNLVIHRDLKPNNILIDTNNVCKLLDFGVAKILDDHDQGHQQTTALPMTRHYAAPEMLRGESASVAVDIYSLGVLLFVLLTESLPYQENQSAHEIEKSIVNKSPPKPSDHIKDKKLAIAIRGDLDAIICKALEANAGDRYLSVEAFKQDLQNYLSGYPVVARPANRWQLLRKFYRRHRLASTLSVVAIATILATAGGAVWQAKQAIAARNQSDQVREYLTSILVNTHAHGTSAEKASIPNLLQQAASDLEDFFPEKNQVQVEMLSLLAQSYIGLGLLQEAEEILIDAEKKSSTFAYKPNMVALLELYDTKVNLYRFQGRLSEMETALEKLENLMPTADQTNAQYFVKALGHRVHLNIDQGNNQTAVDYGQQQLGLASEFLGSDHLLTFYSHNTLAIAHSRNGDNKEVMEQSRIALELAEKLFDNRENHAVVLDTRSIYADALWANGDRENSINERKTIAKETIELLGPAAPLTVFSHSNLANYLVWMGNSEEALHYGQIALPNMQALMPRGSYNTALVHTHIGRAHIGLQNFDDGIKQLTEAREIIKIQQGKDNSRFAIASACLAMATAANGEFKYAVEILTPYLNKDSNFSNRELWLSDPQFLYYSGMALRLSGNNRRAEEQFQTILDNLSLAPKNNLYHYLAKTELSKTKQNPNSVTTLLNSNEVKRFIDWDNFKALNIFDAETAVAKGKLLLNSDPSAAIKLFEESYQFLNSTNPNSRWTGLAAYHYGISLIFKDKNKSDLLIAQAKKNLKDSPFLSDQALLKTLI